MAQNLPQIPSSDGVNRRGFLKCMAWAGTGILWSMKGGILTGCTLEPSTPADKSLDTADFHFVQLSDSHIGFSKEPNQNVTATLQEAIRRINGGPEPEFILHTGDLSHLSKPDEFDTVDQLLRTAHAEKTFYVPGEHDVLTDSGRSFLDRYGKNTRGNGWHSFDYNGVHFVGLVNVMDLKPGGLGRLGDEQLAWLKNDLAGVTSSTPVVVFAHVPLWTVYEPWGWGTDDSAAALTLLRRFGSVTVLNGHIHQVLQKVEGNITFHTACSTAFPQPAPGAGPSPGPMKNVASDKLRSMLGLTSVRVRPHASNLAVIDSTLG
jgi:3',5'-cyclic AMP phosphodiesterase CpdA